MADLKPLMRLKNFQLDQKKKALAELFRLREEQEGKIKMLTDKLARERLELDQQKEKNQQVENQYAFLRFADNMRKRIAAEEKQLTTLDRRIDRARGHMRDAYAEVKKISIIHDRRQADVLQEQERKESREMDEIGIDRHRRRNRSFSRRGEVPSQDERKLRPEKKEKGDL